MSGMDRDYADGFDRRAGRRRFFWASGLAAVLALVAAGLVASEGSAFGRGHWGHRGHPDPAEMKEHMALAVDHMLKRIDATDEQRERASEIAESAFDELFPLMGEHRESHERMVALLSAETVDRDALEELRAESFARFEAASKTLATSLADFAEMLAPEQRTELLEKRHGHRGWRRY